MFHKKKKTFFLIFLSLLYVSSIYGKVNISNTSKKNANEKSCKKEEDNNKKLDSSKLDNPKISNPNVDKSKLLIFYNDNNAKNMNKKPTKKSSSSVLINSNSEKKITEKPEKLNSSKNTNKTKSTSNTNSTNENNDVSSDPKKKKSIISKIKNFFKKKKEPEPYPKTLMEYIKQKNKKILQLELHKQKKKSSRVVYAILFYSTLSLLLYLILAPGIFHIIRSENYKKIILKQYKENKERRIVPYDYDFGDEIPFKKGGGGFYYKDFSEYYDPERKVPNYVYGYYAGIPYVLCRLDSFIDP
ncbi:conserved Plasmodium protein, unknown function [Plasmodium relictum]|uniref:Uncharacterized protein n=1 Tax=Plasmodium relictum TaxID=85471 RepID=A0A1J1H5Z4_PLARL|nr:conserved Plasmodium protein, unknown function [Plasmodium relictum]CRG99025.1 conserved Plasmodium protein, unknown function [Plasmodium relictum]